MEVIILEDIKGLGKLGSSVKVKNGFARNFLFPFNKAIPATDENKEKFESQRADLEKNAADKLTAAKARKVSLLEIDQLTVTAKASEEGRLYGSIGKADLVEAIKSTTDLEVTKNEINSDPIRSIGEYNIVIQLHPEVASTIKVVVKAE